MQSRFCIHDKKGLALQLSKGLDYHAIDFLKIDEKWIGFLRDSVNLIMIQPTDLVTVYSNLFCSLDSKIEEFNSLEDFRDQYGDKYDELLEDYNHFKASPLSF